MTSDEAKARVDQLVNVRDVEDMAQGLVPPEVLAYWLGGAGDEETLRDNETAFSRYRLRPRVCVPGDVDTSTTLLGQSVSMPVGIAPTASHGLACPEGEVGTARAARKCDVLYCVSSGATRSVEEIAGSAGNLLWYQCYPGSGQVGISAREAADRAEELGLSGLVLTVDAPASGHRDREFRAQRANPSFPQYGSAWRSAQPGADLGTVSHRTKYTWPEIERIARRATVPVIVKGILAAEDARLAVEAGASAVWVSNHGGRQLDRVPATLDVLAEVADSVDPGTEVYLDGGVRRGTDVAMALALGARAVFVGRPAVAGLAAAGAYGVRAVLEQFRRELINTMTLLGTPTPQQITRQHICRPPLT